MARFPIYEDTLPTLGEALADAVDNDAKREAFKKDPRAYLIAAGVDPSALEGLELSVLEDTSETLNFVLPAKIDSARAKTDPAYLVELGKSITLSCAHMTEKRVIDFNERKATLNGPDYNRQTGTAD